MVDLTSVNFENYQLSFTQAVTQPRKKIVCGSLQRLPQRPPPPPHPERDGEYDNRGYEQPPRRNTPGYTLEIVIILTYNLFTPDNRVLGT